MKGGLGVCSGGGRVEAEGFGLLQPKLQFEHFFLSNAHKSKLLRER